MWLWTPKIVIPGVLATILGGLLYLYGLIGASPTAPAERTIDGTRISAPIGVAGPLRSAAGEDQSISVLLVGTSLTARGQWPERLRAELELCARAGVDVTRLAKPGASIRWGLPALTARLSDASHPSPDIVVVEFSGNDASPIRGLPLPWMRARSHEMVKLIQAAGAVPFLATMNPGWDREALERPGQNRYHAAYRDIAAETGAGLIDTVPAWRELKPEVRQRLVPDGVHPTEEGMDLIILPAFLVALRPLVCDD